MPFILKRCGFVQTIFAALSFVLCINGPLLGADYYVSPSGLDSHPGTEEQPWRTIQKAADTVESGSNVYVRAGTYYEKIAINVSGSESEGPITFTCYGEDEVIIGGSGVANNPASYTDDIIYMENKGYIRIVGFKICHVNTNEGSGIRLWGRGSYIEIRGGGP